MSVNLASVFSYAGVSLREGEDSWLDLNRVRFLHERGWGYAAPLLVDGITEWNRDNLDLIVREMHRRGLAVIGWATPRNTSGIPVSETVAKMHEAVVRYGLDGVRYQCEAEFEYSNPSMGGTPGGRFGAMNELGAAHRALMPTIPTAVYARVGLNLCDAWWAKAWQYRFRCFVECYGPAEGGTHPGWAAIAAPGSAAPPIVGGWWYRVKLGKIVHLGRVDDNGRTVTVDGQGTFTIGSPAGPRFIDGFDNPKWGAVLGFFPTDWLKIVVPAYKGIGVSSKAAGATLAREVREWQAVVRRYGPATKGYSVYVGPEMTADHWSAISPTVLAGAALLP